MSQYSIVLAIEVWEFGETVVKLLLSGVCGALIGWEREVEEKSAGLRTHMLVALGSCLFTILSLEMESRSGISDPSRVIQGLLIGLGFIAGGVIFREGPSVKGLTTAAGLWILGAVGLAIGMGCYAEGILASLLAFLVIEAIPHIAGKHRKGG